MTNIHYSYRQPLRQSFIVIEDDMLIFWEPIQGSTSYTCLQIVPRGLYDIVFIAFHSNPIGGHLNASIDYVFATIGPKCTPLSNGCAMPVPAAPSLILLAALPRSWCTTSPLMFPFESYLLTVTPLKSTLDSKAAKCT